MNHRLAPTPFTDVNFVLDHFRFGRVVFAVSKWRKDGEQLVALEDGWVLGAHSLLEGHAKGCRPSCPYVKSAVRLGDSASQRYAP